MAKNLAALALQVQDQTRQLKEFPKPVQQAISQLLTDHPTQLKQLADPQYKGESHKIGLMGQKHVLRRVRAH